MLKINTLEIINSLQLLNDMKEDKNKNDLSLTLRHSVVFSLIHIILNTESYQPNLSVIILISTKI